MGLLDKSHECGLCSEKKGKFYEIPDGIFCARCFYRLEDFFKELFIKRGLIRK